MDVNCVQALETIVGLDGICVWEQVDSSFRVAVTAAIAPDTSIAGIVSPATSEELAAVVTCAHQHNWRVLPCGNHSKLSWGGILSCLSPTPHSPLPPPPPSSLLLIRTNRLNRLIEHAVGDLTVTVEAGMKFADLQAILAQAGQFLALDPTYPEQATIGGIVATGDTGSLRQRYNGVRDMLLGLSFVRADGQIAKAGGRVVKNVAGYDLMKLFTGSYGTLGLITQVTFRVYPLPEMSETILLRGDGEAIARVAQTLLSSALTPTSLDFLSSPLLHNLGLGGGTGLAIRFQGITPSVKEQVARSREVGQALGLTDISFPGIEDADLWLRLREQMTVSHHEGMITCKIGIQSSQAIALFQFLQSLALPNWSGQIHAASGLGRLTFFSESDPEKKSGAIAPTTLMQLRDFCQTHRGFLTVLQAPPALKQTMDVWGYPGNALEVMQKIKHQFDPKHLLSPHRFVGNI
jgi:glycolate oxidase FAD binding subunit